MKSSNAGALLDAKNLIHCWALSNDSIPCGTRLRACTLFVVADHNWPPSMRGLAYAVGASDLRNAKLPRVRNPDRRRPRYNRPVPVYSPSDLYGDRAVHVGWRGGELVAGRDGDGGARLGRRSTRLNSSHMSISYAVFCLKKKKQEMMIYVIFLD